MLSARRFNVMQGLIEPHQCLPYRTGIPVRVLRQYLRVCLSHAPMRFGLERSDGAGSRAKQWTVWFIRCSLLYYSLTVATVKGARDRGGGRQAELSLSREFSSLALPVNGLAADRRPCRAGCVASVTVGWASTTSGLVRLAGGESVADSCRKAVSS